jgi:predicted site-specific integrase-resolvase
MRVEFELDQWLSVGQAARSLEVSPPMVNIYCRQGKLRFLETNLGKLIDPGSVERLAQERAARRRGRGRRTPPQEAQA